MKRMDWVIAISFIAVGFTCLIMSMSFIDHSESAHVFIMSAIRYCLWMGIPLVIISLFYMWIKDRNRRKG